MFHYKHGRLSYKVPKLPEYINTDLAEMLMKVALANGQEGQGIHDLFRQEVGYVISSFGHVLNCRRVRDRGEASYEDFADLIEENYAKNGRTTYAIQFLRLVHEMIEEGG